MQSNTQLQVIRSTRRSALALYAALAVCVALGVPATGYAASHAKAMPGASEMHKKDKVVFQVSESDPKNWNLALNNIKNVQEALGKDKVDVELVVYGPGIGMLKAESVAGNRVNDAVANGVKVVACENTMHNLKLTKDDMLKSISYVPGGVIELMEKQKQGWAYIKP